MSGLTENTLAIERRDLKQEFEPNLLPIVGMRGLFEEHYVSIPEDKYDVLEKHGRKT